MRALPLDDRNLDVDRVRLDDQPHLDGVADRQDGCLVLLDRTGHAQEAPEHRQPRLRLAARVVGPRGALGLRHAAPPWWRRSAAV